METNRTFRFTPQLVFGSFIVLLGVIFTLSNIGLIDGEDYLQYWPAFLILYGVVKLVQCRTTSGRIWSVAWIVIGGTMLLNTLHLAHIHIWDYWPIILILVGFGMMSGTWSRHRRFSRQSASIAGDSSVNDSDSIINGMAVMGGYKRTNNSQDFRGGELTAVMGGIELDLRGASIKQGEAILDIFAFWGGVKIRIPEDWSVVLEAVPVLGGFEDKSLPRKSDLSKRLIIRGYAVMGGGEISN
jgi:predicted membrane protein